MDNRFAIRNRITGTVLEGFFFTSLNGAHKAAQASNEYRQKAGIAEGNEDIVAYDRETQKEFPIRKEAADG